MKRCPACEQEKPREDFSHTGYCKECEKTRLDAFSLQKQCGCCTHIGPHWLHMDYLDRESNLDLLERALVYVKDRNAKAADSLIGLYFRNEQARIDNKLRHMRPGISYTPTLVGQQTDLDTRERTLFKAIVQAGNEWKEAYEQATANSSNLALPSRH